MNVSNMAFKIIGIILLSVPNSLLADGGDVPIDSLRGNYEGADNIHWYMQDTLNWNIFKTDPIFHAVPTFCNEDDESRSCSGEGLRRNVPLATSPQPSIINLYIKVDERIPFPWRYANHQVRETNRILRRSGIRARLMISEIRAVDIVGLYGDVLDDIWDKNLASRYRDTADNEADIVAVLVKENDQHDYCGIGSMGLWADIQVIVVACSGGFTFAHEIGHTLGLAHDIDSEGVDPLIRNGRGYVDETFDDLCVTVPATAGTVMSYADCRVPYFSNPDLALSIGSHDEYVVWGDEDADSVTAANETVVMISLANEVQHDSDIKSFDLKSHSTSVSTASHYRSAVGVSGYEGGRPLEKIVD